ncbi:sugar ABC transporter substrate-binding protein [Paenibacillus donghaensis]|uniref:Sugar ABC transporter substrate-binding protein n=2 Tax=Paenibacillus donghaensis TaxID=414771 RepID=A0A2Z2KXL1_9BACL|nr:sugar ABC transporter substrate-binding protein [Paenibacillus donghaensis]
MVAITALTAMLVTTAACSNNGNGNASTNASPSPGGNTAGTESVADAPVLKAITMGNEPKSGLDNFYKELDELTVKDLGIKVRFDYVPWGDEKNQISRAIAAKEYDIYVGGAWSDFANFASKNAFVDLTPMMDQVPELVKHYDGKLDQMKIDGKIYGIPQLGKPGGGSEGMLYREDLREKWNLPEINSLDTVEQYLYKAKEEYPSTPMINDPRYGNNIWTMIAGSKYLRIVQGLAVASVDDPYTVVNMYETTEFKQAAEKAKKWYDDGIADHDILASQGNATAETLELMKVDQKPLEFSNHFGAASGGYIGVLKEANPDFVYGWYDYYMNNVPTFQGVINPQTTTAISIGTQSQYAEEILKLLEKAHTDQKYYNLLMYGVEGENYKLDSEGYINYEGIPTDNVKPAWTGLNDGYMNLQVNYPGEWKKINDDLQAEGIKLTETAPVDPYAGFSFDTSMLATELSNIETVKTQYILPLTCGVSNDIDKDIANVQKQLKNAGYDKYLAELQKQLDALKASK